MYLPYFLILAVLVFIEFFLANTIIRFCGFLASCCYDRKQVLMHYHTRPYYEYARSMNTVISYNIRNNDTKKNVIINLEKHLISDTDSN